MSKTGEESPRRSHGALLAVAALMIVHAVWLAWSATWQSPTLNEPGHLASGLAHWTLGRFEPYAVNPPVVRMVAALPVLATGYNADWSDIRGRPGHRPEFLLGSAFINANGVRSQRQFVLARWACIPFSLLGAWMCFVWGRALFGIAAGVLACGLWCVEPNVVAHGQLITSDIAATSLGLVAMWTFWKWLVQPGWGTATLAGASLGLAILAKFSWLLLIGIWPVIWLASLRRERLALAAGRISRTDLPLTIGIQQSEGSTPARTSQAPGFWGALAQQLAMLLVACYLINVAYGFDGSFSRLDSFQFSSERLAGQSQPGVLGNRFTGTPIGSLRIPLPRQFLLGIDLQKKDLEHFPHASYLRGEWRQGGWWYYYAYAAAVKVPLGLWMLGLTALAIGIGRVWTRRGRTERSGGGPGTTAAGIAVLLIPAAALFATVSSQTAFNHHFRYALPCFGPVIVLTSGVLAGAGRWLKTWAFANWAWIAVSSALAAPFSLSYFNEAAGGMRNGEAHLLHSNLDWGQDLVALTQWMAENAEARPVYLAYYGYFDPVAYGVPAEISPQGPFWGEPPRDWSFKPGWYAVSVNYLRGTRWRLQNSHAYEPLLNETPVGWCGGSIAVYYVDEALARRLTGNVMRKRQ